MTSIGLDGTEIKSRRCCATVRPRNTVRTRIAGVLNYGLAKIQDSMWQARYGRYQDHSDGKSYLMPPMAASSWAGAASSTCRRI